MTSLPRAVLIALAAALGVGVACGTADSVSPPDKIPCNTLYFHGELLPFPPDGASLCAPGAAKGGCNYQTQTGCKAGETCAPHLDKATGTVSPTCRLAGERANREHCDSSSAKAADQCGVGLQCADGTCHRFCCGGDWSACDPGESCIREAEVSLDGGLEPAGTDLCYPVGTCNVLDPEACKSEGRNCRIADPIGHVACMPASDLGLDATCDEALQCGPGLHCVKSSEKAATGVCRRLCPWG
ncbi:MAG TPA: hypothetical protein VF395_18320, partial [Polyangiaceae bacterium]